MRTCPAGHESASEDFCDVCGIRIAAAPLAQGGPTAGAGSPGPEAVPAAAPGEPCPRCGAARSGLFCEACGYSFDTVAPPADPASWAAVVTADRAYYDSVQAAGGQDAAGIGYPESCLERRFSLSGAQVRVGRRSVSRGIEPEIDLTGPPTDPGVSRLHALLIPAGDGTWSVVDPGSANGVLVNGAPITPGVAVPLHAGDRIHLGAWTALTITSG